MATEQTPDQHSKKPNKRILGRRKSDWLIPIILFALGVAAALWAIDNRTRRHDQEIINRGLSTQVQLRERQLQNIEKKENAQSRKPKMP